LGGGEEGRRGGGEEGRRGGRRTAALPSSNVCLSPPSQVAVHRETGQSRGYAFVSYETVEEANAAITNLHNMTVDSRTLRVELARADKEAASGAKPY
jgi:RNA recognition motif-containing protein